jgi:transposase
VARRTIRVIDVVELFQHWHAGRPIGELSSSLRIDPKTVRKYTRPAIEAGITPGGPPLGKEEWATLAASWFPELGDPSVRQSTWPELSVHHDYIGGLLGVVKISTIYQRLRDDRGVKASESSLRRYIEANFSEEIARDAVTVLRDTPPPGDEAQVDYGLLGRWLDPVTKRWRRVWGFLMVLTFSRLIFLRPVLTMDEASWVECHVEAFEFFGGATRRVVPDNLKTGVVKPDLYDPLVNKAFSEFASHYGCLVDPARVRKPKDKARVERPVPYARDSFFAGRSEEFQSLTEMQHEALRWSREVANRRRHRGIDGVAPYDLFEAEEAAFLLPLPGSRFEIAKWSERTVAPDIHVKVGRALYSVPWRLIGKTVDARQGARTVEIFLDGVVVATHARIERGKQTNYDHYPPEKIAFMMRPPAYCRRRAAELGESVAAVVSVLLEVNALYRLRQAQGVISLADKHEAVRLDAACRKALVAGDPAYKTIKGILLAGAEDDEHEEQRVSDAPAHLHGREALFDMGGAR